VSQHPEKLGKYQITGVLGEGAMGVVYRGFDPDIRRVVALKTIRHQPGSSAEATAHAAARFRNEAQAAGRLMHPGIVGVYDFGDDGRVAYIAMEYVEGHTLSAYLGKKIAFGSGDIASIASQLCEALSHAHEHGVWHRDIKPSNVIMTKSGRVKIADFGIARTDTTGLTMANSVLGTPMYMAPEQFMGRPIDHRVDLYGTGVVLYQLVAGRPPFVGPPEALMYKVANETPMPPSTVEGGTGSDVFDTVIGRALAKDPVERWPNGAAFRDAVHRVFGGTVPVTVARDVVYALPMASDYAPTERIPPPGVTPGPITGSSGHAPAHWDPAVLAKVEAALARHVGPLAAVMVRRTARDCHDLPTLYQRLGEQITQQSVREAFLHQLVVTGTGSGGIGATGGSTGVHRAAAPPPTGGSGGSAGLGASGGAPVSDAWLEQAVKLMAVHVGPIAKVVVKRAADRTRQRQALCAQLAEAAPESARAKLLADLAKLA
jgi:eukaryotic-like serine/threonine-protein kinase